LLQLAKQRLILSRFFLFEIITVMQDDDPVYQYAKDMLLDIMAVLYANGRRTMHVGAAMRLMGVDDVTASRHDDERIEIEENFGEVVAQLNIAERLKPQVPKGAIIH
jgi:hypothetical protein